MTIPPLSHPFWRSLSVSGLWRISETMARLPERVILNLADGRLRQVMPWEEGVRFILGLVRVLHRGWSSLHPTVRRKLIHHVFEHLTAWGRGSTTMMVSPTMGCNLSCPGCCAAGDRREDGISTERLHRLYGECKELGIRTIVVSGGEPFLRGDTMELFAAHGDLYFLVYTNGTVLAERGLAGRLAEMGNVLVCISVEGLERETEERRGPGVYGKILRAMEEMREAGLLFGFSATVLRHNSERVLADAFVEHYRGRGCRLGWYFSHMPVGPSPDLSLMPTAQQRLCRYYRLREIRAKHDIVVADHWCDGMLWGGCLCGGRRSFHVNAQGGVEACFFHRFYRDNINERPLSECLSSDYMRGLRCSLGRIDNPLRPCPIIDNPQMLRDLVALHRPLSSHDSAGAILDGRLAEGLDRYAEEVRVLFDPLFERVREGYTWPPSWARSRPGAD